MLNASSRISRKFNFDVRCVVMKYYRYYIVFVLFCSIFLFERETDEEHTFKFTKMMCRHAQFDSLYSHKMSNRRIQCCPTEKNLVPRLNRDLKIWKNFFDLTENKTRFDRSLSSSHPIGVS